MDNRTHHIIDWERIRKGQTINKGDIKFYPTLCGFTAESTHNHIEETDSDCPVCKAIYNTPLFVDVAEDEITIRFNDHDDMIEVVHWTKDEWEEDPTIVPAIANAIRLAYKYPDELIRINIKHIESQYKIKEKQ